MNSVDLNTKNIVNCDGNFKDSVAISNNLREQY